MTISTLTENRKDLVNAITSVTGERMQYQGPPTFAFTDGIFTVNRDGNLEVEDVKANAGVLKIIAAQKLIDDSWDEDRDVLSIELPIKQHSPESLLHLLQILWGKQELINKAVGTNTGFNISSEFISKLKEEPQESVSEFLFSWNEAGGCESTKGISFDEEKICFTGFPYTEDPEWVKAYTDLVSAIGKEAIAVKRVKLAKPDVENEKYYFRVWLVRIGFFGDEDKTTRKKLLSNLSGNSAFRTDEQRALHLQKYRRKKQ
jgi:hypothetical protein